MASSLLNLVHNPAERILKIQCKNQHNSMKYKKYGIKYNEISLQEKEDSYSKLNMEDNADADYTQTKRFCKEFKIGHNHHLHVQRDTLLLTHVFGNFLKYVS